ncbi:MAG TPA: hypothetical protein VNX46_06930, partial [Candidatus Acidoferrum sp.]|nr:hypothetical protein [Candidatus Acidoferrum sp.]
MLLILTTFLGILPGQAALTTSCNDYATIFASKYYLFNNVWGQADDPSGWECIWNNNTSSPLSWGTDFNWHAGSNQYGVKAYPSVVCGWHWGTWSSGSGLPVRIWDNHNVNTGGYFSI